MKLILAKIRWYMAARKNPAAARKYKLYSGVDWKTAYYLAMKIAEAGMVVVLLATALIYLPHVSKFPPHARVYQGDGYMQIAVSAHGCSSAWAEVSYTVHTPQPIIYHPECFAPDGGDTVGANLYMPSMPAGTVTSIAVTVYYPGGRVWRDVLTGPWVVP